MNRLAQAVAERVIADVKTGVASLTGTPEFRAVFNGPPSDLLKAVFDELTQDGGIEATLPDGRGVVIPVVMQVERLPEGVRNPPIGSCGLCDSNHLLNLRNSPTCPIYVGLVPPGQHSNLSQTSTRCDLGLSAHANSGTASSAEWVGDPFVQELIAGALARHNWTSADRDGARRLVEAAIHSADEVDRHEVSRLRAWLVLARIWSIAQGNYPFGKLVSLACGYPPCEAGEVDAEAQLEILAELASRLEDSGFRSGIDQLRSRASKAELEALDEFLGHLQRKCDVPTALARSTPHYYGPFSGPQLEAPPRWWEVLSMEAWTRLLEDDSVRRDAIEIKCTNSVTSQIKGLIPVVASAPTLRICLPDTAPTGMEVTVTRDVGGAVNHKQWDLSVEGACEISDADLPRHKVPIRYAVVPKDAALAKKFKKGSIRLIVLEQWEPGIVICARTASKTTIPKAPRTSRDKVGFECSLLLKGLGRHYLDVYARPGVGVGEEADVSDESGAIDMSRKTRVSRISETEYGFEVEATTDCFYQFPIVRPESEKDELVRIYLEGDEVSAEKCGSEFERLIRLNHARNEPRASTDVQVDRQLRASDLQTWMLSKERVDRSFFPFVLAQDYSEGWRARDWTAKDTIMSQGKFIHDPRPLPSEMQPPQAFLAARAEIAKRVRGPDENGLIEAARLGEWVAADPEFAELIQAYVKSYDEWLDAAPENAAWCDIGIVARIEPDQTTLVQEPDAIVVSPLHPVRLAWQCLAQRSLFLAQRKHPCPAASILDPDCVPDCLVLPLRTAAGGIKNQAFFAVECSSDYWSVLWNASKLDRLTAVASQAPLDQELGILVGGIASGFSVSQVHRALNDVQGMLTAKPVLSLMVSSAAGQNNACNEGIVSWAREQFAGTGDALPLLGSLGPRLLQVLDERENSSRPEDAEISNLSEDTDNSVKWYAGDGHRVTPDLGIIAQLQSSSPGHEPTKISSPVGFGGLLRIRIRQQLKGGSGAFLSESRMGVARAPSGDGLADRTLAALVRLENLADTRFGYTFAPSVHAVQAALNKAVFAAVSSSAVDPACFLGGWLDDAYLWDYDLPSYSSRSGDTTGYYLLSRIKELDREALRSALNRLPDCSLCGDAAIDQILLEVARRGIPTVRGLSSGDCGASGAIGVFVASRLLQDEFRTARDAQSLLPVWVESERSSRIVLVIPVDPFRPHLDDLTKAMGKSSYQRPDLLVVALDIAESHVACKITPIEVKFRGSREVMAPQACLAALQQNKSLSTLLTDLGQRSDEPEMVLWKISFQHLLASIVGFGFRVYSQQGTVANQAERWSEHHSRVVRAIMSDEVKMEVDPIGRLIVVDGSSQSAPRDTDDDDFIETIVLSHSDAAKIVLGSGTTVYEAIRGRVGAWGLLPSGVALDAPSGGGRKAQTPEPASPPKKEPAVAAEPPLRVQNPGELSYPPVNPAMPPISAAPPAPGSTQSAPSTSGEVAAASEKGVQLRVGTTVDGFREEQRFLCLSDTNLNQLNCGVVGDLGTGKTQLLKSLVFQITESAPSNQSIKPKVLIFDYKKDYSSEPFVKATGARVVKPQHLPFNLFDISGATESTTPWLDRFKFFSDLLDKIYSGIGPVQRSMLKRAIKVSYDECELQRRQPNIYDIHESYRRLVGSKPDSVISIIEDLVDMEMFSPESAGIQSFDKFLDGVVVVDLAALGQDDRSKNMLVAIMLNLFYEHMLRIPKRPYVGSEPKRRIIDSFLLVDEADNIMRYEFDVLRKLLLQGREFGVGVILASQYLRHFKSGATDYREPLLSWFIHKVPNITPQELAALGLVGNAPQLAERIKTLALHECLYKSYGVASDIVKGIPFFKLRGAE